MRDPRIAGAAVREWIAMRDRVMARHPIARGDVKESVAIMEQIRFKPGNSEHHGGGDPRNAVRRHSHVYQPGFRERNTYKLKLMAFDSIEVL